MKMLKKLSVLTIIFFSLVLTSCQVYWFDNMASDISENLSTEFKFYSQREEDDSNPVIETITQNIGSRFASDVMPTEKFQSLKPGYILNGWKFYRTFDISTGEKSLSLPDCLSLTNDGYVADVKVTPQKIDFVAIWSPATNTKYTVKHWLQNLARDDYSVEEIHTQILEGTTDTQTEAKALDIKGFVPKEFNQVNINGDGSGEVNIYYDRKKISISVDYNYNGKKEEITAYYGQQLPIEIPDRTEEGYNFSYWEVSFADGSKKNLEKLDLESIIQDFSCKIIWAAATDIKYTVKHWFQNLDVTDYIVDESKTQILKGTTDTQTEAKALEVKGFTVKTFSQVNIKGNGTSVVNIYYNRNKVKTTVVYNDGVHKNEEFTGYYEQNMPVTVPDSAKAGYKFAYWKISYSDKTETKNENKQLTFGYTDSVCEIVWAAATDTKYTVKHWFQNLEITDYVLDESRTQILTGTTDTLTAAVALNETGFTAKTFDQVNINGDESSAINIYYDRIQTTVTVDYGNGTPVVQSSGYYGQSLTCTPPDRSTAGYMFDHWVITYADGTTSTAAGNTFTYGVQNYTCLAVWAYITAYGKVTVTYPDTEPDVALIFTVSFTSTTISTSGVTSGFSTYQWILDGAVLDTTQILNKTISPLSPGYHSVLLVVTDAGGNQYSKEAVVQVTGQ